MTALCVVLSVRQYQMTEPQLERMRWRCIRMLRGDFSIAPWQQTAVIKFLSETKPGKFPSEQTSRDATNAAISYGFEP